VVLVGVDWLVGIDWWGLVDWWTGGWLVGWRIWLVGA